jgi:dipeptidyl aminopeptidase/acylaminoacyl peptidase
MIKDLLKWSYQHFACYVTRGGISMKLNIPPQPPETTTPRKSIVRMKTFVLLLTVLVALSFIGCVGISTYVGWSLTHPERKPIDESPEKYGLLYEDITFPSHDGQVTISGWWIPAQSKSEGSKGKTIILSHGYGHNRIYKRVPALSMAHFLSKKGYNIILFDFRNAGRSGGDITSVGQWEKYDLLGAVDYAKTVQPESEVILIGFSMGASTSLLAAAESEDVIAVIADSPFDDLTRYLESNLPVWSGLPHFPFTPMILNILPWITDLDAKEVSPISTIDQIGNRPLLFIHGGADNAISKENSERLLAASHNPNAELWIVPGAHHVYSRYMDPAAYDRKILEFLSKLD